MNLLLGAIAAAVLAQPIYTWTDAAGVEHFTDDPSTVPSGGKTSRFAPSDETVLRHSGGAEPSLDGPEVVEPAAGQKTRLSQRVGKLCRAGAWSEVRALLDAAEPSRERERAIRAAIGAVERAHRGGQAKEAVEVIDAAITRQPLSSKLRSELYRAVAAAYLGTDELEAAERALRTAQLQDDADPDTLLLVGRLRLRQNDHEGAVKAWERGLRADPSHAALKRMMQKHGNELGHLAAMKRYETEHFVISIDGKDDGALARLAMEEVERAYREVTALYGHAPAHKVPVVIYADQTFSDVRHASWSAGFFDGKIRIPGGGSTAYPGRFQAVLFHEYGHAVFDAARGATVPAWVDEGLAQLAANLVASPPALSCGFGHQAPLRQLQSGFGSLPADEAHRAYRTALHAVQRLEQLHGREKLRKLVALLRGGDSFEKAFAQAFSAEYAAFAASFDEGRCSR